MLEQQKRLWYGTMGVDWAERIDFARMKQERLAKMQATLKKHGIPALIVTSAAAKRYCTGIRSPEHVGPGDSFVLVFAEDANSIVWEVPAIYYHERGRTPWIRPENYRVGSSFWSVSTGRFYREEEGKRVAQEIYDELKKKGLAKERIATESLFPWIRTPLQNLGLNLVDALDIVFETMRTKTQDEISCMRMGGAIVDIAFAAVMEKMRVGMRENEVASLVMEALWKNGCEMTGLPAIRTGPNTAPNHIGRSPTDRIIQPGDLVFMDLWGVSYMGYRTCYYRTFKVGTKPTEKEKDHYKKTYEYLYNAVEVCKAGVEIAEVAKAFPPASVWGLDDERIAVINAMGHNLGLVQYMPPFIARLYIPYFEKERPVLEEGMTLALETWAGEPGVGGCRLENVYLITKNGCENLYCMPDKEILIPPGSTYD
jgi:Xaa-Pro aminopeptidase